MGVLALFVHRGEETCKGNNINIYIDINLW